MNAAPSTFSASTQRAWPRPLRIIVADDDPDTVLTLTMLLEDEGHAVQGVGKGDEVMRHVRRMRPHAVILDLGMPGQSGFAVAQDIRDAYKGRNQPLLIAITGQYKKPADRILSQLVGFDHHILKPYDAEELMDLLRPLTRPPPSHDPES